ERRIGMQQAIDEDDGTIPIVVGFAAIERECWILSGFDPLDEAEEALLQVERKKLGYDPRTHNAGLTACKDDNATHSAKRVLRELTSDNLTRQERCWRATHLDILRSRGQANGLNDFFDCVKTHLVPLIGHTRP